MKKTISIISVILVFFLIFFLQSNFFTWFNIAGIMPNLYVILILFIGLFMKKKIGLILGIIFGFFLDITIGTNIGITAIMLGLIGFIAEILSKNFSKDSRFIITIMVVITTLIYEIIIYIFSILRNNIIIEIMPFIKVLSIEILFNTLITIIIYPIIKKAGYYVENLFGNKMLLTRYF